MCDRNIQNIKKKKTGDSNFMDSLGLEEKCLEETDIFISLFTKHEYAVYEQQSTYCENVNLCISNDVFAKAML